MKGREGRGAHISHLSSYLNWPDQVHVQFPSIHGFNGVIENCNDHRCIASSMNKSTPRQATHLYGLPSANFHLLLSCTGIEEMAYSISINCHLPITAAIFLHWYSQEGILHLYQPPIAICHFPLLALKRGRIASLSIAICQSSTAIILHWQ